MYIIFALKIYNNYDIFFIYTAYEEYFKCLLVRLYIFLLSLKKPVLRVNCTQIWTVYFLRYYAYNENQCQKMEYNYLTFIASCTSLNIDFRNVVIFDYSIINSLRLIIACRFRDAYIRVVFVNFIFWSLFRHYVF